jgi:hypothetical protein
MRPELDDIYVDTYMVLLQNFSLLYLKAHDILCSGRWSWSDAMLYKAVNIYIDRM